MIPLRNPMPSPVRTRSRIGPRDWVALPPHRYALGPALYARVEQAADKGLPRPAILGLSEQHVEQHELLPLARAGADVNRFIGAVAGQAGIEVVGVLGGVFARSRGPQPTQRPALITFLEWPDGYWWMALRFMDQGKLTPQEGVQIHSAAERWPRPGGLGGWWSLSRREGLVLRLNPPGVEGEALDN